MVALNTMQLVDVTVGSHHNLQPGHTRAGTAAVVVSRSVAALGRSHSAQLQHFEAVHCTMTVVLSRSVVAASLTQWEVDYSYFAAAGPIVLRSVVGYSERSLYPAGCFAAREALDRSLAADLGCIETCQGLDLEGAEGMSVVEPADPVESGLAECTGLLGEVHMCLGQRLVYGDLRLMPATLAAGRFLLAEAQRTDQSGCLFVLATQLLLVEEHRLPREVLRYWSGSDMVAVGRICFHHARGTWHRR